MEEDMLLNKSVSDFMRDREEYLKIPPVLSVAGHSDPRDFYTESRISFIHIWETNQYLFKDEEDNEYCTPLNIGNDDVQAWRIIQSMVAEKKIHSNVKDIIRKKEEERKKREEKRENILKHVSLCFQEDEPYLCNHIIQRFVVLSAFIDYWYRWGGWRGVISREKVRLYVASFLSGREKRQESTADLLEEFEKAIRKDGGVQKIV